eukprot:108135_1
MADTFFNDERVEELKEAFKLKAGDAETVSTSDLGPLLEAIGLPPLSAKETIEMETAADPDGSGQVKFDNFLEVLKQKFAPPFDEERLEKAFGVLRNPMTKAISEDEIKHLLLSYNNEVTQDAVQEFAKTIPMDGGNVSIDKMIKELLG